MKFSPSQHWFQKVACIHGTLSFSSANNRMKLIDKKNDFPCGLLNFLKNSFKALLEFTTEFRTCNQCAHIEGNNHFVFQTFWNITPNDALGKPFNDCSFPNARLTYENWVVFSSAGKNLNHPANFFITAYDRIEFVGSGHFSEITAILFQRLISGFGVLIGHALVSSYFLKCGHY